MLRRSVLEEVNYSGVAGNCLRRDQPATVVDEGDVIEHRGNQRVKIACVAGVGKSAESRVDQGGGRFKASSIAADMVAGALEKLAAVVRSQRENVGDFVVFELENFTEQKDDAFVGGKLLHEQIEGFAQRIGKFLSLRAGSLFGENVGF